MTMSSSNNASGAANATAKLKVPSLFAGKAWQQVLARDPLADGQFFYAVKTTKIFCKPSCASRRPERKNVSFFPTAEQARAAGYRACLRCEPEAVTKREDPQVAAIEAVTSYLTEHSAECTKLKDVAKATGVAPLTILRGFKRVLGVSPREFAKAQRVAKFKEKLREPGSNSSSKTRVTAAIYDAGYSSSSRLYEGSDQTLGMTPSTMKAGGAGETIRYTSADTTLGRVMIAATARGVCSISFGDDDDALLIGLKSQFAKAEFKQMDRELSYAVDAVVGALGENPRAVDLPLDVRATAFQQRVWNALRAIPLGETRTYAAVAEELGMPKSVRAVANACAANPVALAIPCHRVIGSRGSLTGYRWGVERKRTLLANEKAV